MDSINRHIINSILHIKNCAKRFRSSPQDNTGSKQQSQDSVSGSLALESTHGKISRDTEADRDRTLCRAVRPNAQGLWGPVGGLMAGCLREGTSELSHENG